MTALINVLSAAATIVGGWAVITYVFPLLEHFLIPAIKDKKVLHSFMGLLNIVLLFLVAEGVIVYLLKVNNELLNYLETLLPIVDVFREFLPYLTYIVIGWFLIMALRRR